MLKSFLILGVFFLMISCNSSSSDAKQGVLARVNDTYLYKDDIKDLIPEGTSAKDSIAILKNYIDRWASQKLLIDAAEINLGKEARDTFDVLIKQYKVDLYTKAYLEEIVLRSVDTLVSDAEMKAYYDENKVNFKTNGMLVQLRYINLQKDNPKFETIKSKFFDFQKKDAKFWETYKLQFKNFALNDSVWVEMSQIYSKLPFIDPDNKEQFIVAGKKIQQPDSLHVYLVKIRNVIDKNQIAPFVYLKPTLKEVILNKRKLQLIKKFERDITDDAIKAKKYEVY